MKIATGFAAELANTFDLKSNMIYLQNILVLGAFAFVFQLLEPIYSLAKG